jgi:predicted HD phosphohydrolase
MVPVNKDTLLIVAAIVFAIGMIYMFKELNKAKQDIDNFKGFSAQVVRHLAPPPEPVSVPEKKLEDIDEVDEKSEE